MGQKNRGTLVPLGKVPTSVGIQLFQEPEKIPASLLEDPSKLDEVIKLRVTGAKTVHQSVRDTLVWLTNTIPTWLTLHENPEEAAEAIAPRLEETWKFVKKFLEHEEPSFKRAAVIAYLNFQFSREFSDHPTASAMLQDLQTRQLFIPKEGGPIPIGRQRYDVPKEFGLKPKDIENIAIAVGEFDKIFQQLTRDQRSAKRKELAQEATEGYTFQDFLDGVPGRYFLEDIPAERKPDGSWYGGGNLLVEVTKNKEVLAIDATGSIDENGTVPTLVDMDVRLFHHTLDWDRPPGSGPAFEKVKKGVASNLGMTDAKAEAYVRKMQLFWYLLTRGIDHKFRQKKATQLKEEYAAKATISSAQFYELDGNKPVYDGRVLLEVEGVWKNGGHIFLLIERSRDEQGVSFLEVLDAPKHVKELLGKLAEERLEEGENFLKLPSTLQKILLVGRGKVNLDAQLQSKVMQRV